MTVSDYSALIFDLDGTILDSAPIICLAMSTACEEFGHRCAPEVFRPYVGPPPWHTFAEVTGEPAAVVEVIVPRYREIYDSMMVRTPVFAGVPDVLKSLGEVRVPMAVATSKLRSAAISLLEQHGLADLFVTIQGAGQTAASASKATVIETAVADLRAAGIDTNKLVMIGDREHDIEGAAQSGIPAILVEWGYAGPDEGRGAIATAGSPRELADLLGV